MPKLEREEMKTATVEFDWNYEQCSREAKLELRVLSKDKGVLMLFNEANIVGHYRIPVSGDMAKATKLIENAKKDFSYQDLSDAFGGDGYGSDIRDTATFFELKNEGVSYEKQPYLKEFKEYYYQRDQIKADLDWWNEAKA